MKQRGHRRARGCETFRCDAEYRVHLRRPPEHVVPDVQVVGAHLAGLQGLGKPAPLDPEDLFGLPALGHVGHDADQALRSAVRLPRHHEAAAGQPQHLPIRPDDPVLRGERVLLVGEVVILLREVAVRGVQRIDVFVGVAADLSAAIGEVEAKKRHAFARPRSRPRHQVRLPGTHAPGGKRHPITRFAFAQRLFCQAACRAVEARGHRTHRLAVGAEVDEADRLDETPPVRAGDRLELDLADRTALQDLADLVLDTLALVRGDVLQRHTRGRGQVGFPRGGQRIAHYRGEVVGGTDATAREVDLDVSQLLGLRHERDYPRFKATFET